MRRLWVSLFAVCALSTSAVRADVMIPGQPYNGPVLQPPTEETLRRGPRMGELRVQSSTLARRERDRIVDLLGPQLERAQGVIDACVDGTVVPAREHSPVSANVFFDRSTTPRVTILHDGEYPRAVGDCVIRGLRTLRVQPAPAGRIHLVVSEVVDPFGGQ